MFALDAVLAFGTIFCLCVFLHRKCGLHSAAAPLVAVTIAILYFSLAGVLGVLRPAGWLFYAACYGLLVALLVLYKKEIFRGLFTPGFVLFMAGCLVLLVRLWVLQPVFTEWDEFVTWGPAAKWMVLQDSLYTTGNFGWFWTTTQSPGLPALAYFVQFFGAGFAPWKVYWAYDMLMVAAAAALCGGLKPAHWKKALPVGVAALLAPFFFSVFFRQVYLNTSYATAYADIAAGMLMGGVVGVYILGRNRVDGVPWQAMLPLASFALMKENLFPLALVVAAWLLLDQMIFLRNTKQKRLYYVLGALVPVAAVLGPYLAWQAHATWANRINPQTGGMQTSMRPGQAVLAALSQLFGAELRSPKLDTVLGNLGSAFMHQRVSMAGGGLATVLLITVLFAVAFVCLQGKKQKGRVALAYGMLAVGFVGYQFVLLVSYSFLFDYPVEAGLQDYGRYVGTYYVGWFLAGLAFLAWAAQQMQTKAKNTRRVPALAALGLPGLLVLYHAIFSAVIPYGHVQGKLWCGLLYFGGLAVLGALVLLMAVLAGGGAKRAANALLATGCALVLLFAWLVPPGLSVLDVPQHRYAAQRQQEAQVQRIAAALPDGARIFFVSQGGTGIEWFTYHYYLLPAHVLDYSVTGGTSLWPPGHNDAAFNPAVALSLPQLESYLAQNGCDAVLITALDDVFVNAYGALFTDELAQVQAPALYLKNDAGLYQPVAW